VVTESWRTLHNAVLSAILLIFGWSNQGWVKMEK